MVVWAKAMPRSAIIWTRSRELSLNVRYHRTHRTMISWSKCRPLKRSCAETSSVIPAVIARYRPFQQFAPEPHYQRFDSVCVTVGAIKNSFHGKIGHNCGLKKRSGTGGKGGEKSH